MPSTRKQEKARKSRVTEMLSDIENLDIMLRGNHLEREGSEFSGSIRRPDSPNFNAPENIEEDMYPNCREKRSKKVRIMAIFQLVQTLVLSLADFEASSV